MKHIEPSVPQRNFAHAQMGACVLCSQIGNRASFPLLATLAVLGGAAIGLHPLGQTGGDPEISPMYLKQPHSSRCALPPEHPNPNIEKEHAHRHTNGHDLKMCKGGNVSKALFEFSFFISARPKKIFL